MIEGMLNSDVLQGVGIMMLSRLVIDIAGER